MSPAAKFQLEKANSALSAAKVLVKEGLPEDAASRLYYSVFHLITALLSERDIEVRTHKGAKSAFNEHIIKTGLLPIDTNRLIGDLFSLRQNADYAIFFHLSEEEIKPLISRTEEFFQQVIPLLEK